jgi:hypothetical protein
MTPLTRNGLPQQSLISVGKDRATCLTRLGRPKEYLMVTVRQVEIDELALPERRRRSTDLFVLNPYPKMQLRKKRDRGSILWNS